MIQLPLLFSEHMMLQQRKPVKIFGTAKPETVISVCLMDQNHTVLASGEAKAASDERFCVTLPAIPAGLDRTLVITDGSETIEIDDVAVGELWLAGGQSNMEYMMNFDAERPQETEALSGLSEELKKSFRFFDYPEISWDGIEKVVDFSNFGKWRCLTEEDLPYFSAVGYYFQRKVRENLDCPVGILACNWGGTKACCGVPEETIRKAGAEVWIEEYEEGLKNIPDLDEAIEAYKKGMQSTVSDPAVPGPGDAIMFPGFSKAMQDDAMNAFPQDVGGMTICPLHPWRPSGLYEFMLKKCMPYTVRGFLWYQGCSDETHPELYAKLMETLIEKWREDFEDPDLPFLMVQLAPYGTWLGNTSERYPLVRKAQEEAADHTKNTWLASIGDAGMYYDIHPKHKRKPGERLALLALRHVYGLDLAADAPRAKSLSYDGNTAVISFENESGLHLTPAENGGLTEEEAKAANFSDPDAPASLPPEENLNALLRTVPEGKISAEIRDDTLRVSLSCSGEAVKPERIEFAELPYYEINVKNGAGLPVFPFTLESRL